jgi:Inner membrane component of T3SS, cytoplasmic domain/Inner membrane component of T3SS, periplasmic domain
MSSTAPLLNQSEHAVAEGKDGEWANTVMQALPSGRKVLRVLNGSHTGAESELTTDRLLVGNLESECDIVLDVKRQERHACLVRVSEDSWTVLAIAGELWLDRTYVEPQQTRELYPGQVVTLGRVAFCIADPDLVDWSAIIPPLELLKPDADGPTPQIALLPNRPAVMQRWRALMLAAGLGLGALVLATASTYLSQAWNLRVPSADEAERKLMSDQKIVASLPFGKELSVEVHPESPRKVIVNGYLPLRSQVPTLAQALGSPKSEVDLRVTALDALGHELTRRFEQMPAERIRYEKKGGFELITSADLFPVHDRQARVSLQEIPALNALSLKANDVVGPDGRPAIVRYERSVERPGDLVVTNIEAVLPRKPFAVQDLRLGDMPSVVLDDGLRYFVGARLPDGGRIQSIDAVHMTITRPDGSTSTFSFEQNSVSRSATADANSRNRGK